MSDYTRHFLLQRILNEKCVIERICNFNSSAGFGFKNASFNIA